MADAPLTFDAPPPHTLTLYRYRLPMKQKFRHATAAREENEGILVRLELADGTVGLGEGVPRPYVTGETINSAIEVIRDTYAARLAGPTPLAEGPLPGSALGVWHNAAWGACELAYLDAVARAARLPLAQLLGRRLNRPVARTIRQRVAGVIGADKPDEVARKLRLMRMFGLRDFKLKVGTSADHTNVNICREQLRRAMDAGRATLRVDANGVWSLDEAIQACRWMAPLGIAAVEQPLRRGDEADLPRLRNEASIPIMVDESLVAESQAAELLATGAADVWNLRVTKNGGLLATLRLVDLARAHGIAVMLGALVGESGILSAAARVVLQLAPEIRYVENSYGSWLLRRDLVREGTRFGYGGRLRPLRGVGLGVTLNEAAVNDLTERVAVISLA
jgi:muconate cycloisomerase